MQLPNADQQHKLSVLRDDFLGKSTNIYILFYVLMVLSSVMTTAAAILIQQENKFPTSAGELDIVATCLAALSTVILSIVAHCDMKRIALDMHNIGSMLNLYLSPLTSATQRADLQKNIYNKRNELNTFWVQLPAVEYETFDVIVSKTFDANVLAGCEQLRDMQQSYKHTGSEEHVDGQQTAIL